MTQRLQHAHSAQQAPLTAVEGMAGAFAASRLDLAPGLDAAVTAHLWQVSACVRLCSKAGLLRVILAASMLSSCGVVSLHFACKGGCQLLYCSLAGSYLGTRPTRTAPDVRRCILCDAPADATWHALPGRCASR